MAIHFQSAQNALHFTILRACDVAGIRRIFKSRQDDASALKTALDEAAGNRLPGKIFLLGVAFPSLFDTSDVHTGELIGRLRDLRTPLTVALLDPESPAAARRHQVESQSETVNDIRSTLQRGLPAIAFWRLQTLLQQSPTKHKWLTSISKGFPKDLSEASHILAEDIAFYVRLYKIDPILFLMGFETCMFVEQYHFGRAEHFVEPMGCIGKHVPVVQYDRSSKAYAFFKAHYDFIWKTAKPDCACDIACDIVRSILENSDLCSQRLRFRE